MYLHPMMAYKNEITEEELQCLQEMGEMVPCERRVEMKKCNYRD